jgi:hypothetical protein
MSTKEQNLIFNVLGRMLIQLSNLVVEALPLGQRPVFLVLLVCGISAADQTEILRCLGTLVDGVHDQLRHRQRDSS